MRLHTRRAGREWENGWRPGKTGKPTTLRKGNRMDNRIMTDAEVAALFGISKATLQRRVRAERPVPGELDLNRAEPQVVGGRRFWVRTRVEALAGLTKGTAGK